MKAILITSFNIKGIILFQFTPQGQAVNYYYVEILKWLCEAWHRKRYALWSNNWILHCGNAPAYKVLSVKQFLAQKLISEMEHPPPFP
jgi:hypothetical protein